MVCWGVITYPHAEQWLPSVLPSVVQVASTASSVTAVWAAYTGEEDVYVISSLDSSIKKLVDFYAALGYDVKIEKTIDNKGDSL